MGLRHFSFAVADYAPPEETILKRFPHRWNGLKAFSVGNDGKPSWFTRKYISDSDLASFGKPGYFLGCGFGSTTQYGMLDIDRGSPYHPLNDHQAYDRLLETLEDVGFARVVVVQSSWSLGLHVYLVVPEPVKSFAFAASLQDVLSRNGFTVAKGILELFPNKKTKDAMFARHRYPLQEGSFILDADGNKVSDKLADFDRLWDAAAEKNDLEAIKGMLKASYKMARGFGLARSQKKINHDKKTGSDFLEWRERLERSIANGWTGDAETNDLLGEIAVYGVVFEGLTDVSELANYILQTAENAPGYWQHCDHRPGGSEAKKTDKRAEEWARSALRHYSPSEKKGGKFKPVEILKEPKGLTPSEKRFDALQRQLKAVGEAIANGLTFKTITEARRWLAKTAGSSLATIAKNWTRLWDKLKDLIKAPEPTPQKEPNPSPLLKLQLLKIMCILAQGKASSDSEEEIPETEKMCILAQGKDLKDFSLSPYKTKLSFLYLSPKKEKEFDPFDPDSEIPIKNIHPKFLSEFKCFALTALSHNSGFSLPSDLDYFAVPRLASEAFTEMIRSGYLDSYEAIEQAIGELNRADPGTAFVILEWLKTLPSLPECDRPKPVSLIAPEDVQSARKARKGKAYRRFLQARSGGAHVS